MELDDRVRALLAGGRGEEAATAAIEALGPGVHRYLCSQHEPDDAADVFQVWAEDVWRGLHAFRFESSLRSWSFRLAGHASARWRRDLWRKRGERLPSSAASLLAASVSSRMVPGGRHDTLRRLREALSTEEQALLFLRIDQGLEWEEVAAVMSAAGEPVDAAALRKRFERIKDRLRRLHEEGERPEDPGAPPAPGPPLGPEEP